MMKYDSFCAFPDFQAVRRNNKTRSSLVMYHLKHRFHCEIGNGLIAVFQGAQRRIQKIAADLSAGRQHTDIVRDPDIFPMEILINLQ